MEDVNKSMQEVRRMEEELENNKSCFCCSWCPNWTCHYKFSNQVSEITTTMKTLCEQSMPFISVSHPPTLHQEVTGSSSYAAFIHTSSSLSAFNQIMEDLKRDDVHFIGIYGKAGIGKTGLAEQVAHTAQGVFDHVILVPLSQNPQVRDAQGFIAGYLNLSLHQLERNEARADTLRLRLKNGDKILLILDDVWKDFNLGAVIGILPSVCKILLTSDSEIHVPNSMHTQMHVELEALSEYEAWTLFKRVASIGDEVRIHDVAKETLAECYGLPKAVVAMGTTLVGRSVHEWGETLQQFKTAKLQIIDSLKEDVTTLRSRRERVNVEIEAAIKKAEKIHTDVEDWLKDVERVMNEVEQFENELKVSIWCFHEREAAAKIEALKASVKDLYAKGDFNQVSHPTPLEPGIRLLSSQDFLFSKAAKSAFDQILKELKTDGVNMIGLFGMGGIGKTTLANQVHNEVIRQRIFDHVVMVTISQKPDVRNIQAKMKEVLGFDMLEQIGSLEERASKFRSKKILIILDDVWQKFKLESVGIMLNDYKGCKILMTTRRRDVCSSMDFQHEIQLQLFSEDESQNFFMKKAGLSNGFELDEVAKQIVAECMCLPIALETVGAALKRKGKDEWLEALEKLRSARLVDIIGVDNDEKNVYKCLQVSYDYLNDKPQGSEAQFVLLLCSLFPEDFDIEVGDLTRYAFGMKLFEKVDSIEDARRKVRVTIRFLKDSCLLLDVGGEEYVKLHDAVRDVLLWIGGTESKERNTLTVIDDVSLKDLIRKKSFQNCKAYRLRQTSFLSFPNTICWNFQILRLF